LVRQQNSAVNIYIERKSSFCSCHPSSLAFETPSSVPACFPIAAKLSWLLQLQAKLLSTCNPSSCSYKPYSASALATLHLPLLCLSGCSFGPTAAVSLLVWLHWQSQANTEGVKIVAEEVVLLLQEAAAAWTSSGFSPVGLENCLCHSSSKDYSSKSLGKIST
jgi:hypothetical protein